MQNTKGKMFMSVMTLDDKEFTRRCAQLMQVVKQNYSPDLIIGIRSGGYLVALKMLECSTFSRIHLVGAKKQRNSTRKKTDKNYLMAILKHIPYVILDCLRIVEHIMLTNYLFCNCNRCGSMPVIWDNDCKIFIHNSQDSNILIVDDAIDTGNTLLCVLEEVKKLCPNATVKTAVLTVTTNKPLVVPDYCLFYHQLIRFPWSYDAK
jgi:hypoxanthine phosphoribosyltransferase